MTSYISFSSSSTAPRRWLSNLTDAPLTLTWPEDLPAIPEHMRGETASYASTEHAYQALRSLNAATAVQFELGGSITMEVFRTWPVSKTKKTTFTITDLYEQKQAFWGKRNCRGIAPKMISSLSPAIAKQVFGLDLSARENREGNLEAELLIWRPILVAKFTQHPPMMSVLKDTAPAVLVEAGRFRSASQYWSAYIDRVENRLVGQNMMGMILTALRADCASH